MSTINSMATFYHGTSVLFNRFDISHLFEGNEKCKFGVGIYLTNEYATAGNYAGKGKDCHYVYTVEIPELTEDNHLWSAQPVSQSIIDKAESKLGKLPDIVKLHGKWFRKYIGNMLINNIGTVRQMYDSASTEAETAASRFLLSIGVLYLAWPQAQKNPDNGKINLAVLDDSIIKIVRIESVEHNCNNKYIKGSEKLVLSYE